MNADIVMSDNTSNVTNERLDMTLDDIIKKNTKSKDSRKRNVNKRERAPIKQRVTATRNTAKNYNAARQRATQEAARAQSFNRARGLILQATSPPPTRTRAGAATRRARLISKRAVQRRQNPASQVNIVSRRRRTNTMNTNSSNTNNLKVTFTNSNLNTNTNTKTNSNRNTGAQGIRLRRTPVRTTRTAMNNRSLRSTINTGSSRSSVLDVHAGNRSGQLRRLSVKQSSRLANNHLQQRRARVVEFNQTRAALREQQIAQIRGIQTRSQNSAPQKITLNERFSNGSNTRNDNQSSQSRGRAFHFEQPPRAKTNNNGRARRRSGNQQQSFIW